MTNVNTLSVKKNSLDSKCSLIQFSIDRLAQLKKWYLLYMVYECGDMDFFNGKSFELPLTEGDLKDLRKMIDRA